MKMTNFSFLTTLIVYLAALSSASALEPQNPATLCERFVSAPEKSNCEKEMTDLKPDWYLAALCADQFEDKAFYACLNTTRLGSFSPEKLDRCSATESTDEGRIQCAQKSVTAKASEIYQPGTIPRQSRGAMQIREAGNH